MRVRIALESNVKKDVTEKFMQCVLKIGALSIKKEKDGGGCDVFCVRSVTVS